MCNKLFLLDLGRMHMARSSFFGDIAEDDLVGKEIVEFPISAYLVEGPEGRVLYDCGCHPDAMKPQGRWSESFQSQFLWSAGEDGEACHLPNRLEQLKEIRARAERISAQVWCGHDVTEFMSLRHSTEG